MWLQRYGWMDGQTDGQNDGQTDKIMGRQTNEWLDMQCMCIYMQKTVIFQQILQFLQKRYGRTNRRTDGPTDAASYRDADASKKLSELMKIYIKDNSESDLGS